MKEENVTYFVIVTIVVSILIVALILINVNGPVRKKHNTTTTTVSTTATTTRETTDYSMDERKDKIMIEGLEEEFTAKTYISRLGFKVDYDIALFQPKVVGNNTVLFTFLNDENNYIKIEKLIESVYYQEYEKQDPIDDVDGYKYNYSFYRNGDVYLKVTKVVNKMEEFDGLRARMDYIIHSLRIDD